MKLEVKLSDGFVLKLDASGITMTDAKGEIVKETGVDSIALDLGAFFPKKKKPRSRQTFSGRRERVVNG